jgi:hypothetical protein
MPPTVMKWRGVKKPYQGYQHRRIQGSRFESNISYAFAIQKSYLGIVVAAAGSLWVNAHASGHVSAVAVVTAVLTN